MLLSPNAVETSAAVLAACALASGGAAYAALYPDSQLCGPVLIAPRRPQEIALTFDDGPNPSATASLLEVLAKHGVRATFFLIGNSIRREPALTREIARAGHLIGNHTMTHPWLTLLPERRVRDEILDCNHALEDTLGTNITLFRPPHGARRPAVLRIAQEAGLTTVNWNIITNDWDPVSSVIILSRIARGLAANRSRGAATNLVLHDGGYDNPRLPTVEATDELLTRLRAARHPPTFVTPDSWLSQA